MKKKTHAIIGLKSKRTCLRKKARSIFLWADRMQKKISDLDAIIKTCCPHPKKYRKEEEVMTSEIEHRVRQVTCLLCEKILE